MKLKQIKSPNFNKVRRKIRFVIIHYTGMQSLRASLSRLTSKKHKVSSHYLISRNGKIINLVDDNNVAWHAGKSKWKNFENLNKTSIGIELVNKGHQFGYQNFSKQQISGLKKLCLVLKKKHKIKDNCFLGHSDIAPLRKKDPGERFPWRKLISKKVKFSLIKVNFNYLERKKIRNIFFKNLYKIGYRYFNIKRSSKSDKLVVKAFQRRYNPTNITGSIDKKTYIICAFLAKNSNY